ncbi:MAG: hydrogenase subunit MbhD domain-containing protein [archaeon]|nr:hydrogenase subunit MbhD domain-containing protein [archaeon]
MLLEILLALSITLSFIAIEQKDLVHSVLVLAGLDLVIAVIFYLLKAPDIALTQAAVCAGLMTFIFLITIYKTERFER